MKRDILILFGKEPRAGAVKTRLAPKLTPDESALLYEAFLRDIAGRRRPFVGSVRLFVAPPFDEARMRSLVPESIDIVAQSGADLMERMVLAFDRTFREEEGGSDGPVGSIVLRNTDSPLLSLQRERQAFQRLADGADVVLGPDRGGGYYLVGLRTPLPDLFRGTTMSAPGNYRQTLERARSLVERVDTLPAEADVDTPADYERLAACLENDPDLRAFAPRTARFFRSRAARA